MKLYANKSLNLRRGKWTSQLAHSLMKYFLLNATYCKSSEAYLLTKSKFKEFEQIVDNAINNSVKLDINWMKSQEDLESLESSLSPYTASIIDHARTELKEPTKTCFAYDDTEQLVPVDELVFEDQEIHTKQVIALNRKTPKDIQFSIGAALSLKSLMEQFHFDGVNYRLNLSGNTDFALWLKGAFAKITVKFDSPDEMKELVLKANQAGVHTSAAYDGDTLHCVVFGASTSDKLDPITGTLKLY